MKTSRFFVLLPVLIAAGFASAGSIEVTPRTASGFVVWPGQSLELPLTVDRTERMDLMVSALSPSLDVFFVAPNHVRYRAGVSRPGFQSWITAVPGLGANYRGIVDDPAPGIWTVEIRAPRFGAPVEGVLNVFFHSDVVLSLVPGEGAYRAGESAAFSAAVFDGGQRLRGLRFEAAVVKPSGARAPVTFRDDGTDPDLSQNDGLYTALVPLDQPGIHGLSVTASGWTMSGEFQRTASATVQAGASTARLTGAFTDSVADDDGDGLPEAIVLSVGAEVEAAGSYRVAAMLRSASGAKLHKSISRELPVGPAVMPVRFTGEELRTQLGEDGPYAVEWLRLERHTETDVELADRRWAPLGATGAYALSSFDRPRLQVASATAAGVDTNGNGLFNLMRATVVLDTEAAGTYSLSATLGAPDGTAIGSSSDSERSLNRGLNPVTFDFDGTLLGRNRVDGPYGITIAVDGPHPSLGVRHSFATVAMPASSWDGFVPDTTPPSLSVTVSPSVLWPPDHRMVEIVPAITVADDQDGAPLVILESVESSEPEMGPGERNGLDIELEGGRIFVRAERFGETAARVYTLRWLARDAAGNATRAECTVTVPHDSGM